MSSAQSNARYLYRCRIQLVQEEKQWERFYGNYKRNHPMRRMNGWMSLSPQPRIPRGNLQTYCAKPHPTKAIDFHRVLCYTDGEQWSGMCTTFCSFFTHSRKRRECYLDKLYTTFLDSPVIAAAKEENGLTRALNSDCRVVFLLFGSMVTLEALVCRIHQAGKLCLVHMDLIDGFSNREAAVDGLVQICHPDGIISTRIPLVRRAQQLGLVGVLRAFLLDSLSIAALLQQLEAARPDYIEVLPGILPSVILEIAGKTPIPLIAGGLIRSKQDVIQALQAGVAAVSTSSPQVWKL